MNAPTDERPTKACETDVFVVRIRSVSTCRPQTESNGKTEGFCRSMFGGRVPRPDDAIVVRHAWPARPCVSTQFLTYHCHARISAARDGTIDHFLLSV